MSTLDATKITKYFKDQNPPDIAKLKKEGKNFIDPYFPHNINSLFSKDKNGKYIDEKNGHNNEVKFHNGIVSNSSTPEKLLWKRPKEMNDKPWKLFEGKIEFDDVSQGALGDCYFCSSIAALSAYPNLITQIFRTKKENDEGYYEILFFIDGEWQIVFVDDYFVYNPTFSKPAFITPNGNELWAILLEKAWAKVNGGYSNIIGGSVSDVIYVLTGFPSEDFQLNEIDSKELFEKMEDATDKGHIMSAGSRSDNAKALESWGVCAGHAYTILQAKAYSDNNRKKTKMEDNRLRLLQLRNPWGESSSEAGEWKGDWSDDDTKNWTAEFKKYFGFQKRNDGVFWMNITDFAKFYDHSSICHLLYGSNIKTYYFDNPKLMKLPVVFNILIKKQNSFAISANFKNGRMNRNLSEVIHPLSMLLFKYNKEREIEKCYTKQALRDSAISMINELEPGYYVLWAYAPIENVTGDKDFKYSLSFCSLEAYEMEYIGVDKNFSLISHLIMKNFEREGKSELEEADRYYFGDDKQSQKNSGIANGIIINKSDDWYMTFKIGANFKDDEFRLFPPFDKSHNFEIKLPPHAKAIYVGMMINTHYSFGTSANISLRSAGEDTPQKEENFDEFLRFDISNSNDSSSQLRTNAIQFLSKKDALKFDPSEFKPEELVKKSVSVVPNAKEIFTKKYPFEMKFLDEKFPAKVVQKTNRWDEVPSESGKLIGEMTFPTFELLRGFFIWNDSQDVYIGYFKDGNFDGQGIKMNKNHQVLLEGTFKNGLMNGQGKQYVNENEYFEGNFVNDCLEGQGKFYFENGGYWEGNFTKSKRNGVGVTHGSKGLFITKYEDDVMIGKQTITEDKLKELQKNGNDAYEKYYNEKENPVSTVDVTNLEEDVTDTDEQIQHKNYLERLEELTKKNPFLMQQLNEIPVIEGQKEEFKEQIYDQNNGACYVGNFAENGKKDGRGVLFNGHNYYIGQFKDDNPTGEFKIYNRHKQLVMKGVLNEKYQMTNGRMYYPTGENYKGELVNKQPHGYGTLYFKDGASWTGNFVNGTMDGEGKYFFDNGLISQLITYKNNQKVKEEAYQREDYAHPDAEKWIKEMKDKHPIEMKHLLAIPPLPGNELNVKWGKKVDNENTYLGEMNEKKKIQGRVCMKIPKNKKRRYFVGYMSGGKKLGIGCYYDDDWNEIFRGNFDDGVQSGYGDDTKANGNHYIGFFSNGKENGFGINTKPNGDRTEGMFEDGKITDDAWQITNDYSKVKKMKFDHGNVIKNESTISTKATKFQDKYYKLKNEFIEKNPEAATLDKLTPVDDYLALEFLSTNNEEGAYIGEATHNGFRHGRGIQTYVNKRNEKYVGYFRYGLRSGKGTLYDANGKVIYEGNFENDEPFGKGKYFKQNGDTIEGDFNRVGEGVGTHTLAAYNQSWTGHFYAWTKDGEGTIKDSKGKILGKTKFSLDRPTS